MKRILISGGSGLVGTALSALLQQQGYHVAHLSRSPHLATASDVQRYYWNPSKKEIALKSLLESDALIHLAGAPVAKRWTPSYKKEIIDSRVESTRFLSEVLAKEKHKIKTVISASAIGCYPHSFEKTYTEADTYGDHFLAQVVQQWEEEIKRVAQQNVRTVALRIGVVLSKKGGALPQMSESIRWGLGAPLGSGRQFIPWIHIEDLCRMFLHALENKDMEGVYNAVAPEAVSNKELTRAIARVLKKPLWLPAVSAFMLKLFMGPMAQMVLMSTKASAEKIQETGFQFTHQELLPALKALYAR